MPTPTREQKAENRLESFRLEPDNFTQENAFDAHPEFANQGYDMIRLNGWDFIGWAYAKDVQPKDMCPYVLMFQKKNTDIKLWQHTPVNCLELVAKRLVGIVTVD